MNVPSPPTPRTPPRAIIKPRGTSRVHCPSCRFPRPIEISSLAPRGDAPTRLPASLIEILCRVARRGSSSRIRTLTIVEAGSIADGLDSAIVSP